MKESKSKFESIRILKSALELLTKRDQAKMYLIAASQLLMSVLDLVGIFLIGMVASISLFGIQSKEPPETVQSFLTLLGIGDLGFQSQVALLGVVAGTILIAKTLVSAYFSRRILYFLNLKTAQVIAKLLKYTLMLPFDHIKSRSSASILFSLTRGVESLLAGVVGSASIIFSEASLLIVVLVGMLFFDPVITIFSIMYFGLIGYFQGKRLNFSARNSQEESSRVLIESEGQILNTFNLYRELHVRNARNKQVQDILNIRTKIANLQSRILFMPYVAKYTIEVSLVTGAILLTGSQLLLQDALGAFTTLSIFLVAATRVSPSILRLQQGLIVFSAKCGESQSTLALLKAANIATQIPNTGNEHVFIQEALGAIELKEVSFQYVNGSTNVIRNLSISVPPGSMYALVGPSGNGKSTLMDLMMGVLQPSVGSVRIDNLDPVEYISHFPRAIGYVPQESVFFNGSLKQNLLLGLNESDFTNEQIKEVLMKVGLDSLVNSQDPNYGLTIGDRGGALSVGQRQRLSLARALIVRPKILFLDEPTSSLDAESEALVSRVINSLHGSTTVVVIAHRLETIKNADKVLYIEEGEIKRSGNYEEVFF